MYYFNAWSITRPIVYQLKLLIQSVPKPKGDFQVREKKPGEAAENIPIYTIVSCILLAGSNICTSKARLVLLYCLCSGITLTFCYMVSVFIVLWAWMWSSLTSTLLGLKHPCVFFSGNFAGYDCGECKFGWTGPSCNLRKAPVTRKNIMSLSVEERQTFLEALQHSKHTIHPQYVIATEHWLGLIDRESNQTRFSNITVYDLFVWQHYYSVRDTLLGEEGPNLFIKR